MKEIVTIEKEKLQKLIDKFFCAVDCCNELNIYERPHLEKVVEKMEKWVKKNFKEFDVEN